jgi:uncharacterized membrane protein
VWNVLDSLPARAALSVVVVLAAVFVGYRVVEYLRGAISKDDTNDDELVRNFEEMRREGDINEAEFRTITSVLGKTQPSQLSGKETSSN